MASISLSRRSWSALSLRSVLFPSLRSTVPLHRFPAHRSLSSSSSSSVSEPTPESPLRSPFEHVALGLSREISRHMDSHVEETVVENIPRFEIPLDGLVSQSVVSHHLAHPINQIRIVQVNRVTKVERGGRIMTCNALIVGGNGRGLGGFGFGKGEDSEKAVERATLNLFRNLQYVDLYESTIPHPVKAHYVQTNVLLMPAKTSRGIRASRIVAAVCAVLGIRDITSKVIGRSNPLNVIRATFGALSQIQSPQDVSRRRGLRVYDVAQKRPIV